MEPSRRLRGFMASRQKCDQARENSAQPPVSFRDDRAMQRLDPGNEFCGQRRRRFDRHPAHQVCIGR